MKWHYWAWFIAVGSASSAPPLAFLLFCGLVANVVYDQVPEETRAEVLQLPGRAGRAVSGQVARLTQGEAPRPSVAVAERPPRPATEYVVGTPSGQELARPRPAGPRTLTPDEFARDPLFAALDADPHRFVIGHTQGGKSSAMHAMAQAWAARGEPVIVCDPDAARGQWPGCEVAGYAEDYRGIGQALDRVRDEFEERSQLYAEGQRDFAPMHLLIDEVHEVFDNVPGARELVFDTLGRRGAKRGIRVTIGTQDNARDTLGLESAAVLANFITAELQKDERGRRVATVYRGNAAKRQHTRQYAVPPLPGAKSFIKAKEEPAPRRAAVAADTPRAETVTARVPERRPAVPMDDLLASLMAELPADVAAQVPDISPERAVRLARALEAQGMTAQSVVKVERDGGDLWIINANKAEASTPDPASARAAPHERKVADMAALKRRRQWALYYQQAAQRGVSFTAAYDAAPVKGNRNRAHAIYKAAKDSIAS